MVDKSLSVSEAGLNFFGHKPVDWLRPPALSTRKLVHDLHVLVYPVATPLVS